MLKTGRNICIWFYLPTVQHRILPSPFLLMFGRQPSTSTFSSQNSFDATSYPGHLRAKLSELRDLVETNLAAVSARQKSTYDVHLKSRTFTQGEPVWLSVPTRGKLNPKWEGGLFGEVSEGSG